MAEAILPLTLTDSVTGALLQARIEADEQGVNVSFVGYGDHGSADRCGRPVFIELHDGKLIIHVWSNINQEDSTHVIDMEKARESQRINSCS